MRKTKSKKKAFTLVELVIVIAVIGILASILIPTFSSIVKKANVSSGKSNATNITKHIMNYSILENKTFYTASEVKEYAVANNLSLKSDLDGYAYFYDYETSIVSFESIEEVVNGEIIEGAVEALADDELDTNRSMVEAISAKRPTCLYIDSSENAITTAIETINNLVTKANKQTTEMENLIDGLADTGIENVNKYFETFHPSKTVYVAEDGYYTTAVGESENYFVERMVFDANAKTISGTASGSKYYVHNTIIVPSTIKQITGTLLSQIEIASVYSVDTSLELKDIKESVSVKDKNTLDEVLQITNFEQGEDYTLSYGELVQETYNQYADPIINFLKPSDISIMKFELIRDIKNGCVIYKAVGTYNSYTSKILTNIGYITNVSAEYNSLTGDIELSLPTDVKSLSNYKGATVSVKYKTTVTEQNEQTNPLTGLKYYSLGEKTISEEVKTVTSETDSKVNLNDFYSWTPTFDSTASGHVNGVIITEVSITLDNKQLFVQTMN